MLLWAVRRDSTVEERKWAKIKPKWPKKEYEGSYTVETACVMAVFCLVMVVLIQQAYRIHDETKNGMNLQEAVEAARHDEDEQAEEIREEAKKRTGLLLSMDGIELGLKKAGGKMEGRISGTGNRGGWALEITERIYEPEEFLRKIAALKQLEERDESQIQEGDAP